MKDAREMLEWNEQQKVLTIELWFLLEPENDDQTILDRASEPLDWQAPFEPADCGPEAKGVLHDQEETGG